MSLTFGSLLLSLCAVLVLSGCRSGGHGAEDDINLKPKKIDACSLLSKSDVEEIIGEAFKDQLPGISLAVEQNGIAFSNCDYNSIAEIYHRPKRAINL